MAMVIIRDAVGAPTCCATSSAVTLVCTTQVPTRCIYPRYARSMRNVLSSVLPFQIMSNIPTKPPPFQVLLPIHDASRMPGETTNLGELGHNIAPTSAPLFLVRSQVECPKGLIPALVVREYPRFTFICLFSTRLHFAIHRTRDRGTTFTEATTALYGVYRLQSPATSALPT